MDTLTQQITQTTDSTDLPHGTVNAMLRVGYGFERFALAVIRDNLHARKNGWTLKNAYLNPDAREKGEQVKTYPTEIIAPDVAEITRGMRTLAVLAARVHADDVPTIERAMRAKLAALGNLDRDLWTAWVTHEKAHLDSVAASVLETDGFAWTDSRKGHGTEIRYNDSAEKGMRAYKALHSGAAPTAYLSERDMA
jgi:hypothetical protein